MTITYKMRELITVTEVCDLFKVHRSTVWRWGKKIQAGEQIKMPDAVLPITKAFIDSDYGTLYFLRSEIELVFNSWTQPPEQDLRTIQALYINSDATDDTDDDEDDDSPLTDEELDHELLRDMTQP